MEIRLYNKEGIYWILQQVLSWIENKYFCYKAEKLILSRIGFLYNYKICPQ